MNNIYVIGAGYVGLANGLALSYSNNVCFIETNKEKLELLRNKKSPIEEKDIQDALVQNFSNIEISESPDVIKDNSFVIIGLPTDFDKKNDSLDTSIIEFVLSEINKVNKDVNIIIKSTIPYGFTERMNEKFENLNIYFCPEFLRENSSLYDAMHPERIIVSPINSGTKAVLDLFKSVCKNSDFKVLEMGSSEAELVKLISNTYLALRVSFFNEVDQFAQINELDSKSIIDGASLDSRIGDYYNNPSFGYGGYCLPKDSMQVATLFEKDKAPLINSINHSNNNRIKFISNFINKEYKNKIIGFYSLSMKKDSDNIRSASMIKVIESINHNSFKKILVFEKSIQNNFFKYIDHSMIVINNNLSDFLSQCDIIIANRLDDNLKIVKNKVFTRDLFHIS